MNKMASWLIPVLLFLFVLRAVGQTDANIPHQGICNDYPDIPISIEPDRLDNLINGMLMAVN